MFTVEMIGDRALVAKLREMPARLQRVLTRKVSALALKLEAKVKDALSGKVLNVRSGSLRRSIAERVVSSTDKVMGYVYSSGDVKYAAIHEFGGKTSAHDILPTKAKALAFMVGGKQVFAKRVHHPGSVMPERSYMRSSLVAMASEIKADLASAPKEAMQ